MVLAFQNATNNELGFFGGMGSHDYNEGAPLDVGSQAAHNPVEETHEVKAVQSAAILNNEDGVFASPTSLVFVVDPFDGSTLIVKVVETHFVSVLHNRTGVLTGVDPRIFDPFFTVGGATLTSPVPGIISVVADIDQIVTLDWQTTVDPNFNLASAVYLVEIATGVFVEIDAGKNLDVKPPAAFQSTFAIPPGLDFNGRKLKVRVIPDTDPGQTFDSPEFVMNGENFTSGTLVIPGPLPPGPPLPPPLVPSLGGPATGVNTGKELDFT